MIERAPGCFGYATTHLSKSKTCEVCIWAETCRSHAFDLIKEIHEDMDVSDWVQQFEQARMAVGKRSVQGVGRIAPRSNANATAFAVTLEGIPARAQAIVRSAIRRGLAVEFNLRTGHNPFREGKPSFMHLACELLITQQGFTREELRQRIQERHPKYTRATVESYLSIAIAALGAFGVHETHGRYVMRMV